MKKKLVFIVTVFVAMLLTVSCTTQTLNSSKVGPGVAFKQPQSQQYVDHAPITEPRYSCSGKKLMYPKLVGMRDINVISAQETYNVPDSLIRANGYEYSGVGSGTGLPSESLENPLSNDSMFAAFSSGLLMDFIKFLIGVVLAGLVLYFLWWLFNQRFRSSNHNEGQRNTTNDSLHNYQPNITVVVEITQTNPAASSNFEKDAMEHHLNVIKEMQKSGGHTDFSLNNFSFHVDVPTSTENKNEKAGTDTTTTTTN